MSSDSDCFYALGGGIDAVTLERAARPERMVEKGKAGFQLTLFPLAPLMHGASQWSVMSQSFVGNKVVLIAKFDPHRVWRLVEEEKANALMITGDAMARPLIEALDAGTSYDASSLLAVSGTAALFSPSVKEDFFRRFPNLVVTEAIGSSESGNNGLVRLQQGHTAMAGGPRVNPQPGTVVLGDDLRPLPPGTGKIGRVARSGDIPLGYYKDPGENGRDVRGRRRRCPLLRARRLGDGRGRRHHHPAGSGLGLDQLGRREDLSRGGRSRDEVAPGCLGCGRGGRPDERWGQRVAAVLELRPGTTITLENLKQHCRTKVAGYKIPSQLHLVDTVLPLPERQARLPLGRGRRHVGAGGAVDPVGASVVLDGEGLLGAAPDRHLDLGTQRFVGLFLQHVEHVIVAYLPRGR
jgi:3-oxocholest-4-en-26-oate---CoA ligase